jgi:putative transport protein
MSLFNASYFILFLIIAIGLILGRINIRGISLDASAVIFVALLFGHLGYQTPPEVQTIGLLFFIFTIGIQAGPGFLNSFRKNELKLLMPPVLVVSLACLLTTGLAWVLHLDSGLACGLFTGALTSTPGLAAAIEATNSPLASIGYSVAYPLAVLAVVLFIRMLPRIQRVDLAEEQARYQKSESFAFPPIVNRNFIVENKNVDGKSIGELNIRSMTQATISRIWHEAHVVTPTPASRLYLGDMVKAVGVSDALEKVSLLIGPETVQEVPLSRGYDVQWILVTNKKVINKSLAELNLLANFNATVTRIRRSSIDITPHPLSTLRFGDKLMVACDVDNMAQVADLLGNNVKRVSETDFLPIFLGITLGVILGRLRIPFFNGLSFQLGLTGGVLATALALSRLGKTGPIIWSLSSTGNQVLRQLGLLFFLTCIGAEAGSHIGAAIKEHGWQLLGLAAVITLLPMLSATFITARIVKLNFLSFLGALTGGMTSTPGLAAVDSMTESSAPHVAYAAVYPLALVFKVLCVHIMAWALS